MELSKIPAVIVGMVVAIIIVTVVAIPIIDNLPATNYTYADNENVGIKLAYEESPTVEIILTDASTKTLTIDGTEITYPASMSILSDAFGIGAASAGTNLYFYSGTNLVLMATGDKISVDNGAWTFTPASGSTQTGQIDWILYPDNAGTWSKYNQNAKISSDTRIYVYGGTAPMVGVAEGTVNGDFSLCFSNPAGSTMTVTINKVAIEGGLSYNADCINGISATNASTGATTTSNGSIYAPIQYKVAVDSQIDTIIDIIPLLLVVSILMGAVALIASRQG